MILVSQKVKDPPAMQEIWGSIPGLGRSPGRGHDNKLQYFCLENPHGQRSLGGYSPSVQFSSVVQSCLTLCDPMDCSTPGLPVHHQLPELAQTHVYQVSDAIQPFYPLSSIYVLYMDTYIQSMYDTICTSTQVHRSCYHSIICIIIPSEVDRLFPQTFIPLT